MHAAAALRRRLFPLIGGLQRVQQRHHVGDVDVLEVKVDPLGPDDHLVLRRRRVVAPVVRAFSRGGDAVLGAVEPPLAEDVVERAAPTGCGRSSNSRVAWAYSSTHTVPEAPLASSQPSRVLQQPVGGLTGSRGGNATCIATAAALC
jgi:hypothetical protein